jgi:hypothetical protein
LKIIFLKLLNNWLYKFQCHITSFAFLTDVSRYCLTLFLIFNRIIFINILSFSLSTEKIKIDCRVGTKMCVFKGKKEKLDNVQDGCVSVYMLSMHWFYNKYIFSSYKYIKFFAIF